MPKWVVKAAVQRLIAACPGSYRINEFLQERVSGTMDLPKTDFLEHLSWDARHAAALREAGLGKPGFRVFELGTGWLPIFAVAMFLSGAGRIVTVDRTPTLKLPRVMRVIERFVDLADEGGLERYLPCVLPARLAVLRGLVQSPPADLESLLDRLGIEFLTSPRALQDFPDRYFDLVSTVGVLQYIDRTELDGFLRLMSRKLHPGGVTCHLVDLRDQFSITDPSIGKLNFLRFSARQWNWIRSAIIPNSRVRFGDYLASFRAAGLHVTADPIERLDASELRRVKLHPDFARCPPDELLMGIVHFSAMRLDDRTAIDVQIATDRRTRIPAAVSGWGSVSTALIGLGNDLFDLLPLASLA